ncbi:uncharacterized protein G2W53_028284 [Senna tora]|uniref:Uncharacterized protein n=1 Tax=Senna tora TaxID=362788 RepID=A0A834T2F9_9FABA|nr:uncharacterized protein G2W53_028284 [Senna tora]
MIKHEERLPRVGGRLRQVSKRPTWRHGHMGEGRPHKLKL